MSHLVDVGIAVRTTKDNPWFDRLIKSLETIPTGIAADLLVEQNPQLTKVEKRIRLFRRSQARYLCLLEDDTEVVHEGWLVNLVIRMSSLPNVALLNPGEVKVLEPVPESLLTETVQELAYVCGFCMLVDRESGIEPDVRAQTIDDLWMSLAARAKGWRCARTEAAIIRHTKQPWASDDLLPEQQADRSRYGEGDSYYSAAQHHAKRLHEAKLLVETFGDLARMTLPSELLNLATDPLQRATYKDVTRFENARGGAVSSDG